MPIRKAEEPHGLTLVNPSAPSAWKSCSLEARHPASKLMKR